MTRYKIQKIQDTRYRIIDTSDKIQDTRIQDTSDKIHESRYNSYRIQNPSDKIQET